LHAANVSLTSWQSQGAGKHLHREPARPVDIRYRSEPTIVKVRLQCESEQQINPLTLFAGKLVGDAPADEASGVGSIVRARES